MSQGKMSLYVWLRQDHILFYIIDCFIGAETIRAGGGPRRRVFRWEIGGEIVKGNTEAFVQHLSERFQRAMREGDASLIHELLRDLGEPVLSVTHRSERQLNGPYAGKFRQPIPQTWAAGARSVH